VKMRGPLRRIFRVFGVRSDPERELDEEIRAHLEMTEEGLRAQGMSEDKARREARRRFGDMRRHRREMIRLEVGRWRMTHVREWLDTARFTLGTAIRSIRRAPGLAVAIVLTLGLGLGANAVMFGVVDRLLLSPPQHITESNQVRRIYQLRPGRSGAEPAVSSALTWPDFESLKQLGGVSEAAAYTVPRPFVLGSGEGASQVEVSAASPSLFSMLGVQAELGRYYEPEEDAEGAPPVVVLSHELWTRGFGADPDVLGRRLLIGPDEWEVVGVAPAGFTGVELAPVDVWLPIQTFKHAIGDSDAFDHLNWWWLRAAVRIEDPALEASVMERASARHVALRAERVAGGTFDPESRLVGGPLTQGRGPNPSAQASVSKWLAGVSLIVLLIACANVANLLLTRSVKLRGEVRMKAALGASPVRLLGDQIFEVLLLVGGGALAALALSHFGAGVLHGALIPNVAFVDTGLGGRLVIFLLVATVLTTLLAGVGPALVASRASGTQGVAQRPRGGTARRTRAQVGLLVLQGTLSVVLLVGAGLFVRSLNAASAVELGYDTDEVVFTRIDWAGTLPASERAEIYRRARERLGTLPGVAQTATTFTVPFESAIANGEPRIPGINQYPGNAAGGPYLNKVSSGYFQTMGLEIVQGRAITDDDDLADAPPVVVVSLEMARDLWLGTDPLEQCLHFQEDSPCTRVVGVVENHHLEALVEEVPSHLYYLNLHHPDAPGPPQGLMVRAAPGVSPRELAPRVARAVTSVAPEVRFVDAYPLIANVEPQLRSWRLGASMFTIFGLLALVVAAIGLYSVLAFDVAQRRPEMGVRSALGASQGEILRMVLRSAVGMSAVGLAIGITISLAASRFLQPLLFEVSVTDPLVYLGVTVALLVVSIVAALLPGWRATQITPSDALRAE